MKKWLLHGRGRVAAACYLAALVFWLALCTVSLAGDAAGRARGAMETVPLTAGDFTLVNMVETDSGLSCTTEDPQMLWTNASGLRVRSVVLRAAYDRSPQEICLYYLLAGQTDYSRAQRVYARANADGSYSFRLPRTDVAALRLDVCSSYCIVSDFSLTLNAPAPLWQYYAPGWWKLFELILYPGLAASAASLFITARRLFGKTGGRARPTESRPAPELETR